MRRRPNALHPFTEQHIAQRRKNHNHQNQNERFQMDTGRACVCHGASKTFQKFLESLNSFSLLDVRRQPKTSIWIGDFTWTFIEPLHPYVPSMNRRFFAILAMVMGLAGCPRNPQKIVSNGFRRMSKNR